MGPTFHDVAGSLCVAAVEVLTAVLPGAAKCTHCCSFVLLFSLVRRSHEPSDSASLLSGRTIVVGILASWLRSSSYIPLWPAQFFCNFLKFAEISSLEFP